MNDILYSNHESKKKIYRYAIVIVLVVNIMLSGILGFQTDLISNVVLSAEIDYNMAKITELSETSITSSNPFDFKDNDNYEKIIHMGITAVSILEKKYEDGEFSDISAYIAASAIEEIMCIKISDIASDDWETADEFFEMWNRIIVNLPEEFNIHLGHITTDRELKDYIGKYGLIGEYYIYLCSQTDVKNDFYGNEIHYKSMNLQCKLNDEQLKQIKTYLDNKLS